MQVEASPRRKEESTMLAKTLVLLALAPTGLLWSQEAREQIPAQAQRGLELFAQRKCSTCHRLEGNGTAIAPDLTRIARLSPRAIKLMVLATRTEYVIAVHLKNGDSMPAIRVADDGKTLQCYDLAKDPPVLRSIEKSQIT